MESGEELLQRHTSRASQLSNDNSMVNVVIVIGWQLHNVYVSLEILGDLTFLDVMVRHRRFQYHHISLFYITP